MKKPKRYSKKTLKRHERILQNIQSKEGDVLDGHFKNNNTSNPTNDALSKAKTGGNSFESNRRKH